MSTETLRAEFEAWYVTDMHRAGFTHATVEDVRKLRDGDGYGKQRAALNGKWKGWQAAQASQAAEIEALKADIVTYVRAAFEQATEVAALRDHLASLRNEGAKIDALEADFAALQHAIVGDSGRSAILAVDGMRKDGERLEWLHQKLFVSKWNGVMDSGSRTSWHIAGDYRHTTVTMNGATFREAIDAAMQTKEASRCDSM